MKRFWVSLMLLLSLLVAGCGVSQEQYDDVLAERDAAQVEVASLQSELATLESDLSNISSTLEVKQQTIEKAKAFVEVLSVMFTPLLSEEEPEPVVTVLTRLNDPVKATGDPELERLYIALVYSQGGDQESRDFVKYLLEQFSLLLE